MKKKFLTRIAACAAAAMLVLGLGLVSAGCSQQSEAPDDPTELVKAELTKGFDQVKDQLTNIDNETLNAMFDADALAQFEAMGLDGAEFVKGLLDGFDYEIGEITINGDKAEAAVTLKMKDLKEWMSNVEESAIQLAMENPNISEAELMSQMGPLMMDALGKVEGMADIPITVTATESNGTWTVDGDALSQEVSQAMMSSLSASE